MLVDIRDKVAALKKSGRTPEETVAAKPTAAYDAKWGQFVIDPPFSPSWFTKASEDKARSEPTQHSSALNLVD